MTTAFLGVMFLVVGLAAMFLMFHLWGYPFDKVAHKSAAPRWAMLLHRCLGYLFGVIYIVLMTYMVPRLTRYQVEFPARTVAHIILGFGIGFLLLIKIAIMRFFRHFEEWMPYLGTAIMLGTVLLLGLSLPFALQERQLANDVTTPDSIARVKALLPTAGLPPEASIGGIASKEGISQGREVLLDKCVRCHDLRTILNKPRGPADWYSTVQRMSDKPALFSPITEEEEYYVTAYLIAVTPDLQKATRRKRVESAAKQAAVAKSDARPDAAFDLAKAKSSFVKQCSQCHPETDCDGSPPKTAADAKSLVERMITQNDAKIPADEIKLIEEYLRVTYVKEQT